MAVTVQRYSKGIVVIHWLTALLMIIMLFLGEDMIKVPRGTSLAESWASLHATLGVSILLLTLLRLALRASQPAPTHMAGIKSWENTAGAAVHLGFYVLMIGLPITGMLALTPYALDRGGGETVHLFGILPAVLAPNVGEGVGELHEIGSKVGYLLLALHVLGALKHQFIDKLPFLQRMKLG